ncbi:polysaccharide deacetylase family protein [Sphingomonas sp. CFBP 8765]|uniref:polysaccharide deacetylase family protein n=1 Tax=unclassified Sphingomonas TaxID=196159 RepID=UPI001782E4F6|nr:polysaccharide deacetylase family protein [Sphingomonas sp. CFBP 8765]
MNDARYRLASPPEPIVWRPSFGPRYTLFVDVEEQFDWNAPFERSGHSTSAMAAFPEAHARFREQGVALTCLVDYPIVDDPAAVEILRDVGADGRSEIGAQLHPWVNPPFGEPLTPAMSFAGNLPEGLEAAKLRFLTDAIATAFGRRPRAYRAGRYGVGPDTVATLTALGYRLDSSVRPGYDYSAEGGPDFSSSDSRPCRRGALLSVPLSTLYVGALRGHGAGLYRALGRVPYARGVASRLGLLSRIALTPEDMPIGAALEAVTIAVGEGVELLNFAFHSPSLVPGNTPYVRDAADLRAFHDWWSAMLTRLDRLGVRNASLDEILENAR